jgi:hypothetical protein
VPASYRSLITGGWVHYFDWNWGSRQFKAEPLSFGTRQSRLFRALAQKQHRTVALKPEDSRALKAWIDLNCPRDRTTAFGKSARFSPDISERRQAGAQA